MSTDGRNCLVADAYRRLASRCAIPLPRCCAWARQSAVSTADSRPDCATRVARLIEARRPARY